MRVNMISLSPKRARVRTLLWLVFSIALLSNMAGIPFTTSIVYASSTDTPQLLSDVNDDGVVDIGDVIEVGKAYGSEPGHLNWNPRADVNNDDLVDIFDLALVVRDRNADANTAVGRLWSDDSYWYKKIPENAPLHPYSAQMANWLVTDQGEYPGIQYKSWTNPVYNAYGDTRISAVYDRDSGKYKYMRVPDGVQPPLEADASVTIIDWYEKKVWDIWRFTIEDDGSYTVGDCYAFPLYGDGLTPEGTWSCGGSSTSSVAYLIRPEEIEAGVINHPLGCALHTPKIHKRVYPPAATSDGRNYDTWAIPEGARIQLDPNLDLDSLGLSRTAKIIAKCMQDYGIVVAESGGSWHIYAEHTFTANWGPEMSGLILSALADLPYNPWRIPGYSVFGATEEDFPSYP
jgi:hypothetical protein